MQDAAEWDAAEWDAAERDAAERDAAEREQSAAEAGVTYIADRLVIEVVVHGWCSANPEPDRRVKLTPIDINLFDSLLVSKQDIWWPAFWLWERKYKQHVLYGPFS